MRLSPPLALMVWLLVWFNPAVASSRTLVFGTHQANLTLPASSRPAPLFMLLTSRGSEPFKGLQKKLNAAGFAVLTYQPDSAAEPSLRQQTRDQYLHLTLKGWLGEARQALQAARETAGVDAQVLWLYGQGEASLIAAQLAQEQPTRGLVLQSPVVGSLAERLTEQFERSLNYLSPYAVGGQIDLTQLQAALTAPASPGIKAQIQWLLDPPKAPFQSPRLNAWMDSNRDGLIDLRQEALSAMRKFYLLRLGRSARHRSSDNLPTLEILLRPLTSPLLILQGGQDSTVSLAQVTDFADRLKTTQPTIRFKLYPELGATLGSATSPLQDPYGPMSAQPLEDLLTWLRTR